MPATESVTDIGGALGVAHTAEPVAIAGALVALDGAGATATVTGDWAFAALEPVDAPLGVIALALDAVCAEEVPVPASDAEPGESELGESAAWFVGWPPLPVCDVLAAGVAG